MSGRTVSLCVLAITAVVNLQAAFWNLEAHKTFAVGLDSLVTALCVAHFVRTLYR